MVLPVYKFIRWRCRLSVIYHNPWAMTLYFMQWLSIIQKVRLRQVQKICTKKVAAFFSPKKNNLPFNKGRLICGGSLWFVLLLWTIFGLLLVCLFVYQLLAQPDQGFQADTHRAAQGFMLAQAIGNGWTNIVIPAHELPAPVMG